MDTRRSTGVVTIATYRRRQVAEAEFDRLRSFSEFDRSRMARLLTAECPTADALSEMLLPRLVDSARSPGVHAAIKSRVVRALGHAFLLEADRRLAGSAAGIAVLTDEKAGGDLRVSLLCRADYLLHRALPSAEQLLLRRRL